MVKVGPYNIDLVPLNSWGKSLSQLARTKGSGFRSVWDRIRERELERCGYKCEICGVSGEKGELLCHEKWCYDESDYTQRLTGYEVVCGGCNLILHMGRTGNIGLVDRAVAHFQFVTGLGKNELNKAVNEAMAEWRVRSTHSWKIDISSDSLAQRFEKQINNLTYKCVSQKIVKDKMAFPLQQFKRGTTQNSKRSPKVIRGEKNENP